MQRLAPLLLAAAIACSSATTTTKDLSTDDAVKRAYKDATGKDIGDLCVDRPPTFPKVVVVGSLVMDRGCSTIGAFVDNRWIPAASDYTAPALASAGWSDTAKRPTLAGAWLAEIGWDGTLVTEDKPAFKFDDTPDFTPLTAIPSENGNVTVTAWVQDPPGMVYEESYRRMEWTFDPTGHLTGRQLEHFTVPGQRLRNTPDAAP